MSAGVPLDFWMHFGYLFYIQKTWKLSNWQKWKYTISAVGINIWFSKRLFNP